MPAITAHNEISEVLHLNTDLFQCDRNVDLVTGLILITFPTIMGKGGVNNRFGGVVEFIVVLISTCLLQVSANPLLPRDNETATAGIVVPAVPSGVPTRGTFFTQVRQMSDGAWQNVTSYEINLTEQNITTGSAVQHKSSAGLFDFEGPVEIAIRYEKGSIDDAQVRPNSYGIVPTVVGDTLKFRLDTPQNLVVQVNGDIFDCLHLFTNTIEANAPTANDTNVLYYGPGLHTVPGNSINVTSGQTLYLAAGAVLQANINFYNVSSAAIKGHGVLANPGGAIRIEWSSDILVEDVVLLNPSNAIVPAVSDRVTVRGIRSISSRQYGDGLDVFCSTNVLVDSVFMRNSDDCIAIYNHRWDYYGDNRNITVRDSSLWADVAHPINVGTHGNTLDPEITEQITFHNIDILDHREYQVNYQGCISLNAGDGNLLTNILAEDIRVENFRQGQLVNFRVMFNENYNTSPGLGIHNITIRNLSYKGDHANMAIMTGYNETRRIESVTFQNLTINGKVISDTMQKPGWFLTSDMVPMHVNEHVSDLKFID